MYVASPVTGETIMENHAPLSLKEITFLNEQDNYFSYGLSEADIVFEYALANGRSCYKAIFHDQYPKKIHPALDVNYKSIESIPKLKFSQHSALLSQYDKEGKNIFVSFSVSCSSNFIYSNGLYYHFKDTFKDIDQNNKNPIAVSNVIVQFVECTDPIFPFTATLSPDKVLGSGCGLVFSNGKAMDYKWIKNENKSIQLLDKNNCSIILTPGHTWWILIDKKASVAFN